MIDKAPVAGWFVRDTPLALGASREKDSVTEPVRTPAVRRINLVPRTCLIEHIL